MFILQFISALLFMSSGKVLVDFRIASVPVSLEICIWWL